MLMFQGLSKCNIDTKNCESKLWNDFNTLWQVHQKNCDHIFCNKGRELFNEVCWLSTIYLLPTQRHASDTLNDIMVNGSTLHK